jgi:hypothetical protein
MANSHNLFQVFNTDLQITDTKKNRSKTTLRRNIQVIIRNFLCKDHTRWVL